MQKKALFNPRQTLVLAYLLAVVLWLVRCLAGSAVMLNYKMQGKMPQVTLAPDELTTESFAAYSSNEWWTAPDDDPNWYLSTDSDPHIYWQGQGYIETVELDAAHRPDHHRAPQQHDELLAGGAGLCLPRPARSR